MDSQKGISFIETLIALILMTSTSLSLLSWQLKINKSQQSYFTELKNLLTAENTYEAKRP